MSSANDPIILFFAMLTALCHLFLVAMLVLGLIGIVSPAGRVRRRFVFRALSPVASLFAFCVAIVTMSGSLYLSEVKHWTPCHLCWVQRALLYPQVLWTALLSWKPSWKWLRRLAIGMLMIDVPVSTYHYFLQKYPSLETSSCNFDNPCTQQYIDRFGYISEPMMALTAALTILTLLLLQRGVSALQMIVWSVTSITTLGILLWVSSDALAMLPLPIVAYLVLTIVDRRNVERSTKTSTAA